MAEQPLLSTALNTDEVEQQVPGANTPLAFTEPPDIVDNRYTISLSQPLTKYSTTFAKAYEAQDPQEQNRKLYALVFEVGIPYRQEVIKALINAQHPCLQKLVAEAVVLISSLQECRQVVILEQSQGKKLQDLLITGRRFTETEIAQEILLPLFEILAEFESLGIAHGRLNLGTIYFNESASPKLMLSECISEPCGYSQHYFYETPGRTQALPMGKGEADTIVDYYALGICSLFLFLGGNPLSALDEHAYTHERLTKGSYIALIGNRDFPVMVDDLLKGLLNDQDNERWNSDQLLPWSKGKRFNLVRPLAPREAPRPVLFDGVQHFNRAALAYALYLNWEDSPPLIHDDKFYRWLELIDPESKDLEEVSLLSEYSDNDNELVARAMLLLNPSGPIRLKRFSAFIEGFGALLAAATLKKGEERAQELKYFDIMLALELPQIWSKQHDRTTLNEYTEYAVQVIENRVNLRRLRASGFGDERFFYDLNPSVPCLSPLIKKYHATTLIALLQALNHLAEDSEASSKSPMDEHIASFITSKLNWEKMPKTNFDNFPNLQGNPEIKTLVLLCAAQQSVGNLPLPGLSGWVCNRLQSVVERFHNYKLRDDLRDKLKEFGQRGRLSPVIQIFNDASMLTRDQEGFKAALAEYYYNHKKIQELSSARKMTQKGQRIGLRFAMFMAYSILLASLLHILNTYIDFIV